MLAGKDDLSFLVEDFYLLNHVTMIRFFGMISFFGDSSFDDDGVADMDGANEAHAVVAIGEGDRVDNIGGHADSDAENKRAMRDAPLELLGFDPFLIHVMREKIACLSGVQHDIGFGDGTAKCFPDFSNFVFFKVYCLNHYLTPLLV